MPLETDPRSDAQASKQQSDLQMLRASITQSRNEVNTLIDYPNSLMDFRRCYFETTIQLTILATITQKLMKNLDYPPIRVIRLIRVQVG